VHVREREKNVSVLTLFLGSFAEPFLRPDWAGLLGASQLTSRMMDDPKFVAKLQAIRSNPASLQSVLATDMEIQQAYIVLSGQEQALREKQMREDAKRAEEQRKRKEEQKKKEAENEARKKQAEFDALPENKKLAFKAKEAGNEA
jgi:hypothetical protein